MSDGTWTIRPADSGAVGALTAALAIDEVTASVLVRRGYCEPAAASAFLAGALPGHDPYLLGDMAAAVALLREAIERGTRICVHGDYDVDGICATTLAVLVLRELGADVGWRLPSRFGDGYGLSLGTVEQLAAEGIGLILTVDCGVTAAPEVARARELGLQVIVTDHHRPGDLLPDCPIVATQLSAYPFPSLCGTGVVYKLAQALLPPDSPSLERHLDLVALATIADVVPLVDENRAFALAGLRRLARTTRPGLQALMRCARVDPAAVDETAVGFRLAPRINAAGRLGQPEAALELLLAEDAVVARDLAVQLESLNRERQAVEERILNSAIAKIEALPAAEQSRRAFCLADESWHEGVIGIVASRLVERYHRPVVLIAGSEQGWKGSGRSIPAYDLHAGIGAGSSHLERYGGHRAAAGLTIAPANLAAFTEAFLAHADASLHDDDLLPSLTVDAVVPGERLTLGLAAELAQLAPFGLGNPGVTLLVNDCELAELKTMGEGGKHLRFRVRQNGRDAGSAVAFGLGADAEHYRQPLRWDVAFRLQENRWNGIVAPQLVIRRVFQTPGRYAELRTWLAEQWRAGAAAWTDEARAVFAELALADGPGRGRRSLLESATFQALLLAGRDGAPAQSGASAQAGGPTQAGAPAQAGAPPREQAAAAA